jgi:predicted metal-dependent phosphoesterase TrpH
MNNADAWSRADIHIHSSHSDGIARIPDIMEYVQNRTDLRVIAITDHNTIDGAVFAESLSALYDFDVVVGEEVSAREGHVIGLYLHEAIRPGMSAADTIRAIEEQGGISVIPHPFSAQGVYGPRGRVRFAADAERGAFHACEAYNSLPYLGWANGRAAEMLSGSRRVAVTGGSDAHVLGAIGRGSTLFLGNTAADLRAGIEAVETRACADRGGVPLAFRYMVRYPAIRRQQALNWNLCKVSA